ncbi:glycosyl transferase family 2, partial [Vibrio cholerae]
EKKSVIKSIPDTLNIMVFNSIKPLRLMAVIGAFASLFSLIFATYSIIQKIFNDQLVDGWASIAVLISFQFMVLFIILSFLSEYIGRILDENNIGEQYAIVNELNSTVMVDENRINVLEESI